MEKPDAPKENVFDKIQKTFKITDKLLRELEQSSKFLSLHVKTAIASYRLRKEANVNDEPTTEN